MSFTVLDRLGKLRAELKARGLDAWLVTSLDPHLSEYLPEHWKFLQFLTGFTGSYGTLVVTAQKALLWTDSRYWEQAAVQLDGSGVELMRLNAPGVPSAGQWLRGNLAEGSVTGCDPRSASESFYRALEVELAEGGVSLAEDQGLMDSVWIERPEAPLRPVYPFANAQLPVASKLTQVRRALQAHHADALVLATLEDIAWLTNLRGSDIACTPVFFAYLLVTDSSLVLYLDPAKAQDEVVQAHLRDNGMECVDIEKLIEDLPTRLENRRVLVDPHAASHALYNLIGNASSAHVVAAERPTALLKSRKRPEELDALRETMCEDGAALCEFFALLDEMLQNGKTPTECELAELLHAERAKRAGFVEDSFPAIVAFGSNAALPHYNPLTGNNARIEPDADTLLLIDSGGQYLGGTTDITRTVLIGRASDAMKTDFTAVLRGHIALACALFPRGVYGSQLDTLVRAPLWEIGADYGHGTGHGVGFFLSVHEGPANISPRTRCDEGSRVEPGLVLSNEPGLYRPGKYGIRTENLVTPRPDETVAERMLPMLRFETLTLAPIDTRLIKTAMMTPVEINWVNDYHNRVKEAMKGRLSSRARRWLERAAEII